MGYDLLVAQCLPKFCTKFHKVCWLVVACFEVFLEHRLNKLEKSFEIFKICFVLKNLYEWLNDSTMFLKVGHYVSLSFIEPYRYIEMVCALRQA